MPKERTNVFVLIKIKSIHNDDLRSFIAARETRAILDVSEVEAEKKHTKTRTVRVRNKEQYLKSVTVRSTFMRSEA